MRAQLRHSGDVTIVDLDGDLVIGDGDEVLRDTLEQLAAEGRSKILLNLSKVSRMDSSGIGELVHGWKQLRKQGGAMRLLRLGDRVKHTLHLSQILPLIEVFEDEKAALAAFAG
ncbi:MAG: STAS domain-containing protein [Acidobacteriota bacterium]